MEEKGAKKLHFWENMSQECFLRQIHSSGLLSWLIDYTKDEELLWENGKEIHGLIHGFIQARVLQSMTSLIGHSHSGIY